MDSTLIASLEELRKELETPVSHIALIRQMVEREKGSKGMPNFSAILTPEERELMTTHISKIQAYLKSQDGADAWDLVIAGFREFIKQ